MLPPVPDETQTDKVKTMIGTLRGRRVHFQCWFAPLGIQNRKVKLVKDLFNYKNPLAVQLNTENAALLRYE